jgi:hypothetical protein
VDVLARLRALITPSGRFSDKSSFGDFSNGFSQSYAVLTLARAGSVPPAAVSFLAGTACPDGGFPQDVRRCVVHVGRGHDGGRGAGAGGRG